MDFLYQEMDPSRADQFEAHLQECTSCTDELASFESTRTLMQSLPEQAPSNTVSDLLLKEATAALQIEKRPLWERLRDSMRIMVLHPAMTAAVTLVVVVGISFYMFKQSPPTSEKLESDRLLPEVVRQPVGAPATSTVQRRPGERQDETKQRALDNLNKEESTATIAYGQAGRATSNVASGSSARRETNEAGRAGKAGYAKTANKSPVATAAPKSAIGDLKQLATKRQFDNRRHVGTRGLWNIKAKGKTASGPKPRRPRASPPRDNTDLDRYDQAAAEPQASPRTSLAKAPPQAKPRPRPKPRAARPSQPAKKSGASLLDDNMQGRAASEAKNKKDGPGAQYWVTRADKAAAAKRCNQALGYYNQALKLQPGLTKKIAARVRVCANILMQGDDTTADSARKRYPMLAGLIAAEQRKVRMRKARRSKKVVAKQKRSKKKAPPQRRAKSQQKKKAAPAPANAADAF